MVDFLQIPNNIRVPFVAVEFNPANAQQGPALLQYQGLLIGQKTGAGAATADTVVGPVSGVADVIASAGRGSMLHRQAVGWFAINPGVPLFLGVLADNGAGVAAQGTIVVTGPATAAGAIALYCGGILVPVAVGSSDASTTIATNIAAAINANLDLPVTASVGSSTVTITYRHKGLVGNSYDVRAGFNGEVLPAGVGLTITAVGTSVAGTTDPSLSNLIAAMATMWFQIIAHPYTGSTNLSAIEAEMASRFGPMRSMDGMAITSASGTYSALETLGEARNSPSSVIIAQPTSAPLTSPSVFAAEAAALVAQSAQADPALPFQTLQFVNAIAPAVTDPNTFTFDERNTMLFDGIATSSVGPGGVVQLERVITTYQKNGAGAADISYLDVTTMLTLLYLRYSFRNRMQTKYARYKVADDGTQFDAGQSVLTPKLAKAEAVTWFIEMMDLGLVQNLAAFKAALVVVRNASNPKELDFLLPPELIDGLIVMAAQIAFGL